MHERLGLFISLIFNNINKIQRNWIISHQLNQTSPFLLPSFWNQTGAVALSKLWILYATTNKRTRTKLLLINRRATGTDPTQDIGWIEMRWTHLDIGVSEEDFGQWIGRGFAHFVGQSIAEELAVDARSGRWLPRQINRTVTRVMSRRHLRFTIGHFKKQTNSSISYANQLRLSTLARPIANWIVRSSYGGGEASHLLDFELELSQLSKPD